MTVEIFTPAPPYLISGIGPYAASWPYGAGAVRAAVVLSGIRTELVAGADFSMTPASSGVAGDLYLSAGAAAAYAGGTLYLSRDTILEQGWAGVLGEREAGLEAELDMLTMKAQEQEQGRDSTLRLDVPSAPFVAVPGAVVMFGPTGQPVAGPQATEVAAAQQAALDAQAAAAAAIAAAASGLGAGANNIWTGDQTLKEDKGWFFGLLHQVRALYSSAGDKFIVQAAAAGTWLSQRFSNFELVNYDNSEPFVRGIADAQVELFYNGGKRFETQAAGAKVTGALTADTAAGAWLATNAEAIAGALATKLITPASLLAALANAETASLLTNGYFSIQLNPTVPRIYFEWGDYSLGAAGGATQRVTFPQAFPNFWITGGQSVFNGAAQEIGITAPDRFGMTLVKGSGDATARSGRYWALGY